MISDAAEGRAELMRMRRDLAEQKAKWPMVRSIAKAMHEAIEENHFTERLRLAQEGRGDDH